MQWRWHRLDEPLEQLDDLLRFDSVEVLQDQNQGAVQPGHLGGQDLESVAEGRPLWGPGEGGGLRKAVRGRAFDGGDEVA